MTYTKTSNMLMCGLFAALTGVAAGIVIPIPFTPVPVSLATLAVMIAGGVLGSRLGTVSMAVYLLIGAFGVPVFSGFTGGIGRLAGPTGGFLIGYIAMAFVVGFMIERFGRCGGRKEFFINCAAMALGTGICYGIGTGGFMVVTGSVLWTALVSCVFPFLIGDVIKILAAAWLVQRLKKHVK